MKLYYTILFFLCANLLSFASVRVKIDQLYYNIDTDNKTASVTYSNYDYNGSDRSNKDYVSGHLIIPSEIIYEEETYQVTSIGIGAFWWCGNLTEVEIPNTITAIGNRAFCACTGLMEVYIPDSVNEIVQNAFSGCNGLKKIEVPNGVTEIGNSAFYGCSNALTISLGSDLKIIGADAFRGCSSVVSIYNYALTPIRISGDHFIFGGINQSNCTLYVPALSVEAYKAAPVWMDFNIQALPTSSLSDTGVGKNEPREFAGKYIQGGQIYIVNDGKKYNLNGIELKR